jgi:hypothetical protein
MVWHLSAAIYFENSTHAARRGRQVSRSPKKKKLQPIFNTKWVSLLCFISNKKKKLTSLQPIFGTNWASLLCFISNKKKKLTI